MASNHEFELFLVKREEATYIRGPYWTYFLRTHNIALNDVVTCSLIREGDEDEDEEAEEDEDEAEQDAVQDENPLDRSEYVFRMVAHDPTGAIKEFQNNPGKFFSMHQNAYIYMLSAMHASII